MRMSCMGERLALPNGGTNLYAERKALGFDIDCIPLHRAFMRRGMPHFVNRLQVQSRAPILVSQRPADRNCTFWI